MLNKVSILQEMNEFLHWSVQKEELHKIIYHHDQIKHQTRNYNVGTTERWRMEMTDQEKEACVVAFKPHLIRLGYSLIG
jgi:hypothetical protein